MFLWNYIILHNSAIFFLTNLYNCLTTIAPWRINTTIDDWNIIDWFHVWISLCFDAPLILICEDFGAVEVIYNIIILYQIKASWFTQCCVCYRSAGPAASWPPCLWERSVRRHHKPLLRLSHAHSEQRDVEDANYAHCDDVSRRDDGADAQTQRRPHQDVQTYQRGTFIYVSFHSHRRW